MLLKTLTKNFNILSNTDADADANAHAMATAIALPVLTYRQAKKDKPQQGLKTLPPFDNTWVVNAIIIQIFYLSFSKSQDKWVFPALTV